MYWKSELDPAHFLSAPLLAWKACLKKTGVKLEVLTDINILLMVEKRIRSGICHAIHSMQKQIISIWKVTIKTLNDHIYCI